MDRAELTKNGRDLVRLATHALHGTLPPQELLAQADLAAVYALAKRHSLQGIAYTALKNCPAAYGEEVVDPALLSRMSRSLARELQKLVAYGAEREAIAAFLSERGCPYVFLKGIVLSEYYPALGTRQMSDNDILFDSRFAGELRRFFKRAGYVTVSYGVGCHDVYAKGPLCFEMHRHLVSRKSRDPADVLYAFAQAADGRKTGRYPSKRLGARFVF